MNEMHHHPCNAVNKYLIPFLTDTMNMFNKNGRGQPGSISAAFATSEFEHHMNEDFLDPIEFIDSYEADENALGLIFHWECWPPADVIEETPDADVIRVLLYCDVRGHEVALISGQNTGDLVLNPEEFRPEFAHLSRALNAQKSSGAQ